MRWRFGDAVPPPGLALDLGSGGGVPGLALARWWPASRWVLLDARERRAVFLAGCGRVSWRSVTGCRSLHAAAEDAGRDDRHRGRFDLVVARSFGPPAVVAECGAPFLREGGRLVVSEPPIDDPRSVARRRSSTLLGLEFEASARFRGRIRRRVAPANAGATHRAAPGRAFPLAGLVGDVPRGTEICRQIRRVPRGTNA